MIDPTAYSTPLSVNVALTEYSRKFYDGTYKWNSEGFTDETGIYREFDCYNPDAQAPTPLPPMYLSDDDIDGGAVGQGSPSGESAVHKLGDDNGSLTFALDVKSRDVVVTVRRDDLFLGYADRQHHIGKMEDALVKSRANKVNLTLEECYRLCAIAETHQQNVNPIKPAKKTIIPELRDLASPSELSDCPSDISEWDVAKPMSKTKSISKKPIDEMFEQDDVDEPKEKPTTRGIAQKVKKGTKKPTTESIKSSPKMETVQTGSYMKGFGETSRRRSTRLSQHGK
ncbi:hypothetical protein G6011_11406 [Alternaria panax]|uniref:Uncharacterized protein n=1 Tax=Alternaria panax TaxID=48097 RepID=A0AAD4IDC5_9PLEO|nr:hypothetical protein G6011_11406 [Alternaria panax]